MVKRLAMLPVLLALLGGVMSGVPLHSPNDKMAKCCDKARSKDGSPAAKAADLCCAVNCSESVPTTSIAWFSFSPGNSVVSKSIAEQIAALFSNEEVSRPLSPYYSRKILSRVLQPKFIQHHSLLI